MALDISDDNDLALLQPQFFITLDDASHLDGKHIVFGTVSGPTIFNALRIGGTDVDEETNQPTIMEEAPRIERAKIMENMIHTDIVPSQTIPWKNLLSEGDAPKKKKKRKGVKNVNVLSFGDEFEEESPDIGGMKSSHDVIQSKSLSKEVDNKLKQVVVDGGNKEPTRTEQPIDDKRKKKEARKESPPNKKNDDEPQESSKLATRSVPVDGGGGKAKDSPKESEKLEEDDAENISKSKKDKSKKPKLSLVEARRAKYSKKGAKDNKNREEDTMAKLMAFQSKVKKQVSGSDRTKSDGDDDLASRMARRSRTDENREKNMVLGDQAVSYHGQVLENDEDVQSDWMKTRFKCRKHMDHDAKLGGDGRSANDYEVVDDQNPDQSHRKLHKRHHKHHR
jgi:peptidyl-prolyl cis-trans isomerase SDCCAG10